MCCEAPRELRMHGGRQNERVRMSERVGGWEDPPECRRNLNLPSYFFFSYISHPLDLHKSFADSAAVSRSSQEANQEGGWGMDEVRGHHGCDEIFLQQPGECGGEGKLAELITFIRWCRSRKTAQKVWKEKGEDLFYYYHYFSHENMLKSWSTRWNNTLFPPLPQPPFVLSVWIPALWALADTDVDPISPFADQYCLRLLARRTAFNYNQAAWWSFTLIFFFSSSSSRSLRLCVW